MSTICVCVHALILAQRVAAIKLPLPHNLDLNIGYTYLLACRALKINSTVRSCQLVATLILIHTCIYTYAYIHRFARHIYRGVL